MAEPDSPYRILLVEDEEHLLDVIKMNLEMEGYQVIVSVSGKQALEKLKGARFDLCIMDVMLPELDGFTVTRMIRLENIKTPILFLTARNTPQDRVEGLKIGGDDYLTKPFNLEELLLRVEKLIERKKSNREFKSDKDYVEFGGNTVNFSSFEISGVNVGQKTLTQREIKLLRLLIEKKNQVISREEILETIWGYDVFPSTRTIDNYILAFRKYFEPDQKNPRYFHAIRGVGYKFSN